MRRSFKASSLVDEYHSMNTLKKQRSSELHELLPMANQPPIPAEKSLMRTEKLERLRAGLYLKTGKLSNDYADPDSASRSPEKSASNPPENTP